jgi:alpha-tubulin suppressor-like RCC1 family protein
VVGVGAAHTCAVEARGPLRCWGAHAFGQLGNGLTALFPIPVEVPSLRGATALALGRAFTCALRGEDGEVVCAGFNNVGQLGGSSGSAGALPAVEPAPVTVTFNRVGGPPLPPIRRLSAGAAHACAVSSSGRTLCWGHNQEGQVLPSPTSATAVFGAFDVFPMLQVRAVSPGGTHTCAIDVTGALRCWGSNDRGESGQTSLGVRASGQPVPGVSDVTAVAAGDRFTCVRTTDGRVECFGANDLGQCGIGALTPSSISQVAQRRPAVAAGAEEVTAGQQHACARVGDRISCWGSNRYGQLGFPTTGTGLEPGPTSVMSLSGVVQVSAGGLFTCARVAGRVWCWGGNFHGQLGNGRFANSAAPVEVALPRTEVAVDVVAGEEHACARTESGRVYCWGSNHLGQLVQSAPLWISRAEEGVVRWPR